MSAPTDSTKDHPRADPSHGPIPEPPASLPHKEEHHLHPHGKPTPYFPVYNKDCKDCSGKGCKKCELAPPHKDGHHGHGHCHNCGIAWGVAGVAIAVGAFSLLKWKKVI